MSNALIFGLGYTALRIAARLRRAGWQVDATGRDGNIAFEDAQEALSAATHVISSVPPAGNADPVLTRYGEGLTGKWLGYLSSTGVYGDAGGGWVDESAPLNGRRDGRIAADLAWQALGGHIFRLPGIYGPGRSVFDRLRTGAAHRVCLLEQVFSRVHVDDIACGVVASLNAPPGTYNLADDRPASQNAVVEAACELLGIEPPPHIALGGLSAASRAFYAENRRVSNGKAKRILGWRPNYPDYTAGLRALSAMSSPANVSDAPTADNTVQR